MTAAVVLVAVVLWWRPRRASRQRVPEVDAELAGRLVVLGLGSGLSPHGALVEAARLAPPPTSVALRRAAHHAASRGFHAAADADPDLARWLEVIARASAVGAPVAAELSAHLATEAAHRHERRLAAAKSLPVRLALPLTLLVLPGVVLLTVGPSLLGAVTGLADPNGLLP